MCLGIPGQITALDETDGPMPMGAVSFGGVVKKVCLAYTPDALVGDYVIVHAGFALSAVDEAEARKTLRLIEEMAAAGEQRGADG